MAWALAEGGAASSSRSGARQWPLAIVPTGWSPLPPRHPCGSVAKRSQRARPSDGCMRRNKAALIHPNQRGRLILLGDSGQRFATRLQSAFQALPLALNHAGVFLFFRHHTANQPQQLWIIVRQLVGEASVNEDGRARSLGAGFAAAHQALSDGLGKIFATFSTGWLAISFVRSIQSSKVRKTLPFCNVGQRDNHPREFASLRPIQRSGARCQRRFPKA